MSSEIQILLDMGFSKENAERALKETGNTGVEPAMEWLLSHQEKSEDESEEKKVVDKCSEASEGTSTDTQDGAKSLKCEDCGKLFPGIPEAEYHATKSGHSNFSESSDSVKTLTEEEKQAQLLKVQEMLKIRRREREEKERQDQLEREKARRIMGKELLTAKQKFEEQELKKAIDQRKREKEEERLARQRVRDQIQKDRLDREAKFASSSDVLPDPPKPQQDLPQPQKSDSSTKNYSDTKLQIRLLNGDKLVESFGVQESLAAVRLFVQQSCSQCAGVPFTFATSFPKKEFNEDDMQTPLAHLGLVPSAVLMVKKL